MALAAGTRLGSYEILTPIGAGGMGEVYKARDTRLERFVAIKVLPEHIAGRADLRQRFEREARAVASLNHPHICVLYDIGDQDGASYMVMEYLEGETLAARIQKGAVGLEQTLKFAQQAADAYDRAHRAGVTHRDIKPANIMLTRDGVKLLDFGLAKSTAKPGPSEETLTAGLTADGTLLGTPQYMAPEQFEGKEADARSDIWAFGGVLYEMLTGQKAFQGKNYASLIGAILAAEPAPEPLRQVSPPLLEKLVKRCLAKDPEDRYQSMRDLVLDLQQASAIASETPAVQGRRWLWPAIAGLMAMASLAMAFFLLRETGQNAAAALIRFRVALPDDKGLRAASHSSSVAVSANGQRIAFVTGGSEGELFHRPLGGGEAISVPGVRGDVKAPFLSPDGQWVAAFHNGKLRRAPVAGGPVETICDVPSGHGGAWNRQGLIVFTGSHGSGLSGVTERGGVIKRLTTPKLESGEVAHYWPTFFAR
jgi:serine/threonine-protein kinase